MKKVSKSTICKMAILFRQAYLSIYRSESNIQEMSTFIMKNINFYINMLEEIKQNTPYSLNENNSPRLISCFCSKQFQEKDFILISSVFQNFMKRINSGFTLKDAELIEIGFKMERLYWNVLEIKIGRNKVKRIRKVEHYGNNLLLGGSYYSLKELYKIYNLT